MVDSGALLKRYTCKSVSGVRIPPSPPVLPYQELLDTGLNFHNSLCVWKEWKTVLTAPKYSLLKLRQKGAQFPLGILMVLVEGETQRVGEVRLRLGGAVQLQK